MRPLIDADILCYEIGFAAETGWKQDTTPPFDYVENLLVERIDMICREAGGDQPPTLFLTGKTNFRNEIAKLRPYKNRAGLKPFHYYNIKAYIQGMYDFRMVEGLEADDLMSIEQTRCNAESYHHRTIICSRDKDLRQVPGLHYGWECHKQPSFGPHLVDEFGKIEHIGNTIKGYGGLFFYAQCLIGDGVDTVPGIPRIGPVKAMKILENVKTLDEAFKAVLEAYRGVYGDDAEAQLLEQGRLLWMVRELNEDGSPKMWEFPNA